MNDLQELLYSKYNSILLKNKELKKHTAELEMNAQEASQILSKLANEKIENEKILEARVEELESLKSNNQNAQHPEKFTQNLFDLDCKLKDLNAAK